MNIEAQNFKIEMTLNELWNTAFDIRWMLENILKTHWVNHQATWKQNETERLRRCEQMFLAVGRPDLYNEIFVKATEIFDAWNKTNAG